MKKHTHQFFQIKNIFKYGPIRAEKEGVKVVCAICGEVRDLWEDGEIEISIEGKNE